MDRIQTLVKTYAPFSLLLLAIGLTGYCFFRPIDIIFLAKFGGVVVAILTIYIISISLDAKKHMSECFTSFDDISKKLAESDTQIKNIDGKIEDVEKIAIVMRKELDRINQTQTEIIISSNRFYTLLPELRNKAKLRVQLTQLDPEPPSVYGDSVRKKYFDETAEFARENPGVKVQRIMSIPTISKLEWTKELIKSSENLNNLHLAYIRIDDIENSTPIPPILSIQIIDEKEMLLLDLRYSYMPMAFKPCLYLRDSEAVKQIFSQYYDSLWERLATDNAAWKRNIRDCDIISGFILKDGMDSKGYEEKLEWIRKLIESGQNKSLK